MKFYNYITEKFTPTGRQNIDEILKQAEKWKSDLRKLTKAYKSLEVPKEGDNKEIRKWKEMWKALLKFQENWHDWAFDYILERNKDEGPDEREFRKKSWSAYMAMSPSNLMNMSYIRDIEKHAIDTEKIIKDRQKVINDYNRKFREAFKALEELLEYEQENIDRINKLQNFTYGGVKVKIKADDKSKFSLERTESFLKNLKNYIDKLKSKKVGVLAKDLRIVFDLTEKNTSAAAQYDMASDSIVILSMGFTDSEGVFFHELGHRLYYVFITKNAEEMWEEFIKQHRVEITEKNVNDFIDKFKPILVNPDKKMKFESDEWIRYFLYKNDVSIELIGIYQKLLFGFYENILGSRKEEYSDLEIKEILDQYIGSYTYKYFITDYGKTNASEAFAETFKIYMMDKFQKLHPIVKEVFRSVVNSVDAIRIEEMKETNIEKYLKGEKWD